MIRQVLDVIKGADAAVPVPELERRLGVSTDEERRALVDALAKLLFDEGKLQYDPQSCGYRARSEAAT